MAGLEDLTAADIRYVLARLDRDHVEELALTIRDHWHVLGLNGVAFEAAYMPGDGTHYGLLFTVLAPTVPVLGADGGGSGGYPPTTATGCYPFDGSHAVVTYVQHGASLIVGRHEFVHPARIQERAPKLSPASVLALAVLINAVTGSSPEWEERLVEIANEGGKQ